MNELTSLTPEQVAQKNRNKKIAVRWITIPVLVLLAVLFAWTVARFVFSVVGGNSLITNIVNFLLSGIGLIAMVMLPIGIVIGVIFLIKD